MKVAVTGAGGFLGWSVARRLARLGHAVRAFCRRPRPDLEEAGIPVVAGDLCDGDALREACRGAEAVVHCAAKVGLWGPYEEFYRTNVRGTAEVLRACRELGVPRLVFTSSPSAACAGDAAGLDESAPIPGRFDSHYGATKAAAEELVLSAASPELATTALRPHLVWGPGEDKLVKRLLDRARAGRLSRIGSSDKLVDTTYVDDAAEAHVLAVERLAPGGPVSGKAYYISGGEPRPVWSVINGILGAAGLPPVERRVPAPAAWAAATACELLYAAARRAEEPPLTRFLVRQLTTAHWFDISAARRDLGYVPRTSFAEGLERLRAWLESRKGEET